MACGCCVLDTFLCWKLKVATVFSTIFISVGSFFGIIIHLLDVIAWADPNFDIHGGFKAAWRSHVWEGWLACNLVMVFCNIFMIVASVLLYLAIKRFPVYYEYNITQGYLGVLICYMLVELGVACYQFSWYGPNTFRLPYLVFTFMYWLLRTFIHFAICIILNSRLAEMDYEIKYGEKKIIGTHQSRDILTSREFLEMRRQMNASQSLA